MWDPTTGELRRILPQGPDSQAQWGRSVDVSPDGRLVAGEGREVVFVWSVQDGRLVARLQQQQVIALAFSPDGRRLVTGSLEGDVFAETPAPDVRLIASHETVSKSLVVALARADRTPHQSIRAPGWAIPSAQMHWA